MIAAITNTRNRAFAGRVIWVILVLLTSPNPLEVAWIRVLFLFAPLVLVPLALDLADPAGGGGLPDQLWPVILAVQLPAALLLAVGFLLPAGWMAALCALPWLGTTALISVVGLLRLFRRGLRPLDRLCQDAGLLYLVVGGAWALADRVGFRPLDFSPIIVLLTAIHFHYAGFILPILTGLVLKYGGASRLAQGGAGGVIVGVPLLAAGITATQLQLGPLAEFIAAWFLALSGILVALAHIQLAMRHAGQPGVRALWLVAALSLLISMSLAAAYGSRSLALISWLSIPRMWALHGTANAFGFGLAGVLAWRSAKF